MKELEWQRETIKVARARGGYGFKMSNRFLIGIPDLLIKLPRRPTAVIEVKWSRALKTLDRVDLDVTVPQANHLTDFADAGGSSWVLSFVTRPNEVGIQMFGRYQGEFTIATSSWDGSLLQSTHRWCKLRDRAEAIWQTLEANL